MMYTEYTTRNLNEYYKLVSVIDGVKNPEQYDAFKNMVEQFARNCDFRQDNLKRLAWLRTLKLDLRGWREYRSYKTSTMTQIEAVINLCNLWTEQYDQWIQDEKAEEEELEKLKKKKIDINGFGTCFKIKTKKKKNNGRTKN